ncbi:MAG: polysaccharide deacetylase family protein [Actinomycetota bacterium]|nr:polysaccharide deacetylase family protein [Actinomycetota bacterium]
MRPALIPQIVTCLVLSLVGSITLSSGAAAAPSRPPSEWVIGPDKKVVMLTFNGQAGKKGIGHVKRVLRRRHVKASFFFSGRWVAHHKKRARRVVRHGHILGNKGYGRTSLASLDDTALRRSIRRSQRALRRVGAYPRPFLRASRGALDLRVMNVAGSMGYGIVSSSHHPGGASSRKVKRHVLRRARPGSIIALDLWRKSHRRVLPRVIKGLRRKGFSFKTINGLEHVRPVRWDVTLRAGATGPTVGLLDKRLRSQSYPAGASNGVFDYELLQSVYAYEKVHRMTRDGVVPPAELRRILLSKRPRVKKRGPRRFVEIDISRQVLFEVRGRKVIKTLPVSSGNNEPYTSEGVNYVAHTPRGAFRIERKIAGWRVSHLGRLYYPSYFIGGFAIHGSSSVPVYPASHGCVRLPMYVSKGFFYRNPVGRAVFVHD